MKRFLVLPVLVLSACGGNTEMGGNRPRVSYQDIQPAAGMTYEEYRNHDMGEGDSGVAQKRFIMLDRNNNGRLSTQELGGD
ncbi:MAG: hypothetical protein DI551_03615 [Micavibrio aeruginosavorus]|uniref:EF-hand domain-containing protein n=1 Tax=Micavibrio aeruginosavorus TaxID=349221 RepID=A0A2W5PRB5_9BACT|nr:MAG: hypothetical protein DI551_03615 [Micavibrio aeruginosavorus]